MTSTVNRIIQRYGITRIHYSVIIFGSTPRKHFDFSKTFPNKDVLVRVVSRLPKRSGRPDLAKALESVKKVYELRQVRPNAKKVVVVILDNKSVNTTKELKENAAFIVDKGILAICVGVGSSIEFKELQIITEEDRNIIQVKRNKNPDELAKEIMAIILRSKLTCFDTFFPFFLLLISVRIIILQRSQRNKHFTSTNCFVYRFVEQ